MIDRAAKALADGKALGWVQGRMEFGPRALGGRSILGDPRSPAMQKTLNLRVKYRESFRPFAPSVLLEDVAQWFDLDEESPYMLLVANVREERCIAMTDAAEAAVRDRQAQRAALRNSGRYPCRLFGADPDREQSDQSAVSRPDQPVSRPDRLPGRRQHELQRSRRADRLHRRTTRFAASWDRRLKRW